MLLQQVPQRILLIRPSALGDVCRTVGVLASLRQAFPNAAIDWIVQDDFAPAVQAHPAVDEIIGFPRSHFTKLGKGPGSLLAMLGWLRSLRKKHYDLVLDCQGLARSGMMTFVTGAKTRIGQRSAREFAWLAYNQRAPKDKSTLLPPHTVDQMFLLIEHLGIPVIRDMRLFVEQTHASWWDQQRENLGIASGPYAVLAPTSRWLSKRWPIDRFAQLIEPLLQRGFTGVVVIGSPSEASQVQPLFSGHDGGRAPLINLVGKTGIGQTMAVLAGAGIIIANDSAPLHIAVGFDRPCVGLFGPTEPAIVGPYQRNDAVVRGYHPGPGEKIHFKDAKLGDSLMRFISTATVIQAIDRQLAMRRDLPRTDAKSRPANAPVEAGS